MTSSSKIAELEIPRQPTGMAYCKETCSVLLKTEYAIEYCHSSPSGFSMQPQKTLNLKEEPLSILSPLSVHFAPKMGAIFVGCEENKGIYVLDGKSHKLIKKFAQNMDRNFHFIAVDETEHPQGCTVYASSFVHDNLTKLDYNSGKMLSELPVEAPFNVILKDDKLYLICAKDSDECILVIDKHSLEIQSKLELSGWSRLCGLCLDESGNVCVTALDKSKHRFIYSFDDGGNLVREVPLSDFYEDKVILQMVCVDNDDMIILAVDSGKPRWALSRFKLN